MVFDTSLSCLPDIAMFCSYSSFHFPPLQGFYIHRPTPYSFTLHTTHYIPTRWLPQQIRFVSLTIYYQESKTEMKEERGIEEDEEEKYIPNEPHTKDNSSKSRAGLSQSYANTRPYKVAAADFIPRSPYGVLSIWVFIFLLA